jgi:hypothetical protein
MPRSGKKVSIGRELASARRSLRALEQSLARLAAQVRDIGRNNSATRGGKPRRKLKLLPSRLKALRLHGRYIGYLRHLKPRAKAEVRALRAKKGVRAAIKKAKKLIGI